MRVSTLIETQNQILGAMAAITGTPFSLHYCSDRVPGRRAAYSIRIPLSKTRVPKSLKRIALEVEVAGQRFTEQFPPQPKQHYTYTWDGKDAEGRIVRRRQSARIRVGYVYDAVYPRPETTRWQEQRKALGAWDARTLGLGGWSLSLHHAYDPVGRILYLGDGQRRSNLDIDLASTAQGNGAAGSSSIPSADGSERYIFDPAGRHLRTLHALTGAVLYSFAYDEAGRLAAITDADGNTIRIERNAEGMSMAIVAPYGQRTTLTTNTDGYLTRIANPAGEAVQLSYFENGLLAILTDPNGHDYRFTYDDAGRLVRHEAPGGGKLLARTRIDNGSQVSVVTEDGREFTYLLERLPTGDERWTNACCNSKTVIHVGVDGDREIAYPDGMTVRMEQQPDPHLGPLVSLLKRATFRTPGGLEATTSLVRSVTVTDSPHPLSLATLIDQANLNGDVYESTFDAAQRRITRQTPEGRQHTVKLDEAGRVLEARMQGLAPVTFAYDARGHVARIEQAGRTLHFTYDARGLVRTLANAAGNRWQYAWDEADRMVQAILPSGRMYQFAYDAADNLIQITMPSGAVHRLMYTAANLEAGYTPPENGDYTVSYNNNREVTGYVLPGGRTVHSRYDEGGRLQQVSYPEATVASTYEEASQTLIDITRTSIGGETAQSIGFAYDGNLVTEIVYQGVTSGRFHYRYDNGFSLTGIQLDDQPEIELIRNRDGLLTKMGPFTLHREGPAGAPSRISDGTLTVDAEYDNLGSPTVRTYSVNEKQIYQARITYDNAGRIAEKQETVGDTSHMYHYAYDADGQLLEVKRDGEVVERYSYDENGNRSTSEQARYNAQDQLIARGDVHYAFDADGFMTRRRGDAFTYSTVGELLEVKLADGKTISYAYDGLGRRVARTDASGTYQYLYGNPDNPYQVSAVRDPGGTLRFYYYDEPGHLFAIQRGDAWYYVATDQVGTPRVVFDAEGQPVKDLDYDSYGAVTADSNDAFDLSIGFAGGLVDADTGLVRFGLRDYEPAAGRWTAKDPILFDSDDPNLYRYVWNLPLNRVDPTGTQGNNVCQGCRDGLRHCYDGSLRHGLPVACLKSMGMGLGAAGIGTKRIVYKFMGIGRWTVGALFTVMWQACVLGAGVRSWEYHITCITRYLGCMTGCFPQCPPPSASPSPSPGWSVGSGSTGRTSPSGNRYQD